MTTGGGSPLAIRCPSSLAGRVGSRTLTRTPFGEGTNTKGFVKKNQFMRALANVGSTRQNIKTLLHRYKNMIPCTKFSPHEFSTAHIQPLRTWAWCIVVRQDGLLRLWLMGRCEGRGGVRNLTSKSEVARGQGGGPCGIPNSSVWWGVGGGLCVFGEHHIYQNF